MFPSSVFLILVLVALLVLMQQGRRWWILVIAMIPLVWQVASLDAKLAGLGVHALRPLTGIEAALSLTLLHGFSVNGLWDRMGGTRQRKALGLFGAYVLCVTMFVWVRIVPVQWTMDTTPLFHLLTIGFLPPLIVLSVNELRRRKMENGRRSS